MRGLAVALEFLRQAIRTIATAFPLSKLPISAGWLSFRNPRHYLERGNRFVINFQRSILVTVNAGPPDLDHRFMRPSACSAIGHKPDEKRYWTPSVCSMSKLTEKALQTSGSLITLRDSGRGCSLVTTVFPLVTP